MSRRLYECSESSADAASVKALSVVQSVNANVFLGDCCVKESKAFTESLIISDKNGFQAVTTKKGKRLLGSSSNSDDSENETQLKKRALDNQPIGICSEGFRQVLYFKGVEYNLAFQIRRRPLAYQNEIAKICGGTIDSADWRLVSECLF